MCHWRIWSVENLNIFSYQIEPSKVCFWNNSFSNVARTLRKAITCPFQRSGQRERGAQAKSDNRSKTAMTSTARDPSLYYEGGLKNIYIPMQAKAGPTPASSTM